MISTISSEISFFGNSSSVSFKEVYEELSKASKAAKAKFVNSLGLFAFEIVSNIK
jgi:hypothetical protein